MTDRRDQCGMLAMLIGDGRPVLAFVGLALMLCGSFALFQSATGDFLPHDVNYLGLTPKQLCGMHQCRVVHFMFHDRVAFGGALIALGLVYVWLAEVPLRSGESWAWWAIAVSGILGFASFFTCLGYGYFDLWHGVATVLVLAGFIVGLTRSRSAAWPWPAWKLFNRSNEYRGRLPLLLTAFGLCLGGLTICIVGATCVFVPQDLNFMGVTASELHAINPRLVPLIAHDRASFGGALMSCGVAWLFCVWCGKPSRSLWHVLCGSGAIGFASAIGVHLIVGYIDFVHLGPAMLGSALFVVGIWLSFEPMCSTPKSVVKEIAQ